MVGILIALQPSDDDPSTSLAPALATGNTVVLKPSELTPLTALLLGEIADDAGFPQACQRGPAVWGRPRAPHLPNTRLVKKVIFTGGTEAGRAIARRRGAIRQGDPRTRRQIPGPRVRRHARRGRRPGVRLSVDSSRAGQTCIAGSRLLVQRAHLRRFRRALSKGRVVRIGDPRPGHPARPRHLGARAGTVLDYVRIGLDEGAEARRGRSRRPVPGRPGGFFVEPTVLADVTNDMRVRAEEIFGPVRDRGPFERRGRRRVAWPTTSRSAWAPGSGPVTSRGPPGRRTTSRPAWCGSTTTTGSTVLPWGGVKESGIGQEAGWESFDDFTTVSHRDVRTAGDDVDWYGGVATDRLN